jgi:hypothetical protein
MGLSTNYGEPVDTDHGMRLISTAHDLGVTFFDTAEAYGPFANETLVGQALVPILDQVVFATKFGFEFAPTRRLNSAHTSRSPVPAAADARTRAEPRTLIPGICLSSHQSPRSLEEERGDPTEAADRPRARRELHR